MKKALLLAALAVAAVAFFAFDLDRLLTFDALKHGQDALAAQRERSPVAFAAAYFALYVLVTAVSLPGAVIMTLAGGALFGLALGTLIVSFASTIGATLAFLASRFLLRDLVRHRFGDKLAAVDAGIARDGAFYLFTLRLVPLFPFFLINLLMGLTPIRARTFYWVSQLGMLAGTVVYVNAGTRLAAIDSPAGILSPALLASFALLGVFPLLAQRVVAAIRRRRVYARWPRPRRFDRNLVVIGAGAAGLVSAYIAAAVRAKVTLVEAGRMGGDCLNTGCVPSKALISSAKLAHRLRDAERFGLVAGSPRVDFPAVVAHIRDAIRTIAPHDSVERYAALGVDVATGHARLVDPWTVEIARNDGGLERLTTRAVVIAAGARPTVPPLPGLDDVGYLTSDTLWDALAEYDAPPSRLVVLGGGPIGCELAQAFARLGSRVTLVEAAPRLLGREDDEVCTLARDALEADGVEVLAGHAAIRCERAAPAGDKRLVVASGGAERAIDFDALLVAVGRSARLAGYGLEALGVPTERTVTTNEYLETLYPNIHAAGDVAGPYQFTHTAAHTAWYATINALFGCLRRFRVDYRTIPMATFIDPEVARVGLNERDALERGVAYDVTRFDLAGLDRAIVDGTTAGFVKVLTAPGRDRILGATIAGPHAGDLIAEFVLAMRHGLGLNKILATLHIYPTLAEANKFAAGEWRRAHAPARLLALAERFHRWRRA